MANDSERFFYLEIYVKAGNPNLLTGLDRWLHLGLISDRQVLHLSRKYLTCPVPQVNKVSKAPKNDKCPEILATATIIETKPHIISQIWQAFLDELSIRWLLFLGIFLVVISSGVLAATQWHNFPVTGQYTILWLYTLGFWGIAFWSNKQNNLQLTSRTLKNLAILLIPINFWAISSFNLISNFWGSILAAIATISLAIIGYWQCRERNVGFWFLPLFLLLSYFHLGWGSTSFPLIAVYLGIVSIIVLYCLPFFKRQNIFQIDNLLVLLSGWLILLIRAIVIDTNSVAEVSLAIALAAWLLATVYLDREKKLLNITTESPIDQSEIIATAFFNKVFQIFCTIIMVVTWLISLLVGIFDTELLLWQTTAINGLAIHLFSQRLRLYWRKRDLTAIFLIGLQSLLVGKELIPDAIKATGIALAIKISNTQYLPESVFSVTLFPYVILFVLVASWLYRQEKPHLALYCELLTLVLGIVLTSLSWFNPTWRSLNLGLSALTLSYVAYIRSPQRVTLIYLSHCLGIFTVISIVSLLLLNLSHMAWGIFLLFLAIAEWGILIFQQSQPTYKIVTSQYSRSWYQSCWYFGLLLSGVSYVLLLSGVQQHSTLTGSIGGLSWLLIPFALTIFAKYTRSIRYRRLAISLSCVALMSAQILTVTHFPTRTVGLALATSLMLVNAHYLRKTIVAVIHLGLALGLVSSLLWEFVTGSNWLIVGAIAVISLHRIRLYFLQQIATPRLDYISQRVAKGILGVGAEVNNYKLSRKYIQAVDYWAIAITAIALTVITLKYFDVAINNNLLPINAGHSLITGILIGGATYVRYQHSSPINEERDTEEEQNALLEPQTDISRIYGSNLAIYSLGWIVELSVFSLIILLGGIKIAIATANIILGLISLWLITQLRSSASARLASLSHLTILYALLGIGWRLFYFNSYTGLITLGAALIGIGISKYRVQHQKTIAYLSLAGVSLGIYELVIYQMSRSPGGSIADGFTILSLVAAALAFTYRLTAWWWRKHNRKDVMLCPCGTPVSNAGAGHTSPGGNLQGQPLACTVRQLLFNLSLATIIVTAHFHWAIASIFKIIAAAIAIETATPRLTIVSIAISFLLGSYALIQGRDNSQSKKSANDWWVYVGLVEITATLVYSRLIIDKLSLFDPWRVVFTCAIALIIYQLPWQNFGWRTTPWQRTALVIPALMALVTAETISYFSLLVTAAFYLRIAYYQKNLRWSYISLGFINWGVMRFIWQYNSEAIWFAAVFSLSLLYIAQFDPDIQHNRQQRHHLRLFASGILCLVALFYQDTGIIPSVISLAIILAGLGLRVRAFLYVGTITFVLTIIYQLIILVFTYSILKWIFGLLTGTIAIAIAANFESKRNNFSDRLQTYTNKLKQWQ